MTEKSATPAVVPDDTIKEVVQAKQKDLRKSKQMSIHTNPGDNSKYISHNLELMKLGRPDMTNAEIIRQRVIEYFSICERNDMKPSVEGMALAFGADRKLLWRWANGSESHQVPQEGRTILKAAYTTLNAMMTDYMQNGKINPVSGIFLMKNNLGYTDQTEIVVTPNNPLGDVVNAEEIAQKYAELPGE